VQLKDPYLRRFWFPTPGNLGIGVTAYTLLEAEALARKAAATLGWELASGSVVEDVDVRTLDQGHVIPNMGPPNFHGIWFPRL
jgi:hypothetical protein